MQWVLQNFCEFATDYPSLLRSLKDPLKMRAAEKIIQFPFAVPVVEEKTEEELARISERKKEQGRKLQEMAAKSRQEKVRCDLFMGSCMHVLISTGPQLTQRENELQHLLELREKREVESKKDWLVRKP